MNSHLFIEASAGTGKTYTIERLVLQRLQEPLEDGSFPSISQIAVMTFTKAAARELSLRIKNAIVNGITQAESEKKCPLKRPLKRLLQRAQADFEKAHISTIHSFCFSLLSDYMKEKQGEFGAIIPEDLLFSMVRDFLATGLPNDPLFISQLRIVLEHFRYDFEALAKEVVFKLSEHWTSPLLTSENELSEDELLVKIQKHLDSVPQDAFQQLEELSLQFTGCRSRDGTLKKELVQAFTAYAEKNLSALLLNPLYASDIFSTPKKGALYRFEFLEQLLTLEPLLKQFAQPQAIIQRVAFKCRDFVRVQMKRKKLYSYDELLLQMELMLQDEEFLSFIKNRFRYVIVDEFQDTDPLQWSILQKAFLANGCYLVLVGDPKQAIYSFRNADVYSFLQAKEALSGSNRHTLTTNYRASFSMVKAINTLFSGAHSKELFSLPKWQSSIEAPLSLSSKQEEQGTPAVHFFVLEASLGKKRTWPTEEMEEELLFPFIVEQIQLLGETFGSTYGGAFRKFAILVKDRYQADRVSLFLKKNNIPTTFWRRPSVLGSSAHKFLERFFDLMATPKDLSKLIRFLSHEPFLYDEKKLAFETVESYAHFVEELVSIKKYEHSFSRLFEALLNSFWDGYCLRNLIAGQEEGKQMLRDLEALFDIIVDSFEGLFFDELVLALKLLPNPDLYPTRWDKSEDGVTVITMHSSKGLEFDVVFAIAIATRPPPKGDEEYESEKIRQLYVACTRAKSLLFLPVLIDLDQKIPPKGAFSPLERYFALLQKTNTNLENTLQFLVEESEGTIVCYKAKPTLKEITEEIIPTPLPEEVFTPKKIQGRALQCRSFSSQNKKKREVAGSFFADPYSGIVFHELIRKRIEEGALSSDPNIELAMQAPLGDFCLKDIDLKRALCEVDFLFESEGVCTRGCIDLVFEHKEQVYILDWKTHYLGDTKECYEEAALVKAVSSYGLEEQAHIYTQAVLRSILQKKVFGGFFFVFVRGLLLEASSVVYFPAKRFLV